MNPALLTGISGLSSRTSLFIRFFFGAGGANGGASGGANALHPNFAPGAVQAYTVKTKPVTLNF